MVARVKRQASFLAVISGSLLLAGHFSGASRWEAIVGVLGQFVEITLPLQIAFLVIIAVSSLGGAIVILGGLLILEDRTRLAKLLILLGTGFGIISFFLVLGLAAFRGDLPVASTPLVVVVGIGLSIAARLLAK